MQYTDKYSYMVLSYSGRSNLVLIRYMYESVKAILVYICNCTREWSGNSTCENSLDTGLTPWVVCAEGTTG